MVATSLLACFGFLSVAFCIIPVESLDNFTEPWSVQELISVTSKLCPRSRICTDREPALKGKSCCLDCSCDKTCSEQNNCCFPAVDPFREKQSCLWTSLKTVDEISPVMYYMTDKCPPDIQHLHPSYTDCGNTRVAFWGSLYPVYSPNTGRIYKNHVCADCHSITDGIMWEIEVSAYCHWLPYNINHNYRCNIRFKYNGDNKKLPRSEECGITCNQTEFDIPLELQTTASKDDILNACHGDLEDHFYLGITYKNIFCAICDSAFLYPFDQTSTLCPLLFFETSNKFSWTLNEEYTSRTLLENSRQIDHPMACKTNDNAINEDCVELHCPYRQFYGHELQCHNLVNRWNVDGYSIAIRIQLFQAINIYPGTEEYELERWFVSPWPKHWVIQLVYYDRGISFAHFDDTPSLILIMRRNTNDKLKDVVDEVSEYMPRPWIVTIDGKSTTRYSHFLEYQVIKQTTIIESDGKYERYNHVPDWTTYFYVNNQNGTLNLPPLSALELKPIYKVRTISTFYFDPLIRITKLFFCPLIYVKVEVNVNYFEYNDRIFFSAEYELAGQGQVVICQQDSPYQYTVSSAISRHYHNFIMCFVFLTYLPLTYPY